MEADHQQKQEISMRRKRQELGDRAAENLARVEQEREQEIRKV